VAAAGGAWLDAPVSGSTALASQGQLTIMVGGDADALERARPVLDALAKAVFHLGEAGAGAAMKLAVNGVVAVLNEAVAEGLVLAERCGIPRELAYDVLAGGAAGAPYVQYKREAFLRPDETPVAFTVDLLAKDLDLIVGLARELGVQADAIEAAAATMQRARAAGLGAADMARVADVVRA
jgi:3-hydroxyisobutyrate dehydrogenase-like beta-hydroxyacid dehydrogenase